MKKILLFTLILTLFPTLSSATLTKDLKLGMKGPQVIKLQTLLVYEGYLDKDSAKGVYDKSTLKAVKEYQVKNKLPSTGVVGKLTRVQMNAGSNNVAKNGDVLTIHYKGTLENGQEFDNSYNRGEPIGFILGKGMVIQGWDEGLVGVKKGDKKHLVIPGDKAYGDQEIKGPDGKVLIPKNATLVFDLEIMEIVPKVKVDEMMKAQASLSQKGDGLSTKEYVIDAFKAIDIYGASLQEHYRAEIAYLDEILGSIEQTPNDPVVEIFKTLTTLRKERIKKTQTWINKTVDLKHQKLVFYEKQNDKFYQKNFQSYVEKSLAEEKEFYEKQMSILRKDQEEYDTRLKKVQGDLQNRNISSPSVNLGNVPQVSTPPTSQPSSYPTLPVSMSTPRITIPGQFASTLTNFVFRGRTANDPTGIRTLCSFNGEPEIARSNWMVNDNEIRSEVIGSLAGTYTCHFSIDGTNVRSPNITVVWP